MTTEAAQTPSTDEKFAAVAVRVPDVLIPAEGVDPATWAVVACDQYTSQPDYWQEVEELVGDKPSTLRLTFPEVYLEDPSTDARILNINATMRKYVDDGLLRTVERSFVLVRRQLPHGTTRWGLMVALDLDAYSWDSSSHTLIRSTEGTIMDRLPPRIRIREDAEIELPHIMVLMSDAQRQVIEPLAAQVDSLTQLYDTDLMQDGGHVTGWAVDGEHLDAVAEGLTALANTLDPENQLLFAMGDGNHSFATAKSIWEKIKTTLPNSERENHPARYCLVELVNIYDGGITFEPIHRVLFGLSRKDFEAELSRHCATFTVEDCSDVKAVVQGLGGSGHRFGLCDESGFTLYAVDDPAGAIPAATVQQVINSLVDAGSCTVDYIHGDDVTAELGQQPGNLGLFLPPVAKDTFFDAILRDGALPRKTFSMGEANEKRYYFEARRIV